MWGFVPTMRQTEAGGITQHIGAYNITVRDKSITFIDTPGAYPGLEAVAIESYEADLTKYAIAAAKRGLHIFMDKPGGESVSDFARLIALAKEQNLVLNFGYMYRKNPAVVALLDMIKQGELGKVTCVEAHMDCDHTDRVRAWLGNFQGGMTYFLGCHLIDLIYRIQGKPNKIIPMNASTGISGVQSKDYGFAVFEYDTGPSFFKTSSAALCADSLW